MRVLVVVPDLEIGGTQRYVVRLVPRLRALGIDIEVCSLELRGPLIGELQPHTRIHGTGFTGWTSRARSHVLPRSVWEIAGILRSGRFDAVHSYLFWPDVLASFAGRLSRRRQIVVSRRALHAGRHPERRSLHALEAASNRAATAMVANSRAVLADAERTEAWLPRRRTVIYNGVDVNAYPRAHPGAGKALRIACVANFNEWKDQVSAVEAVGLVRRAGIDVTLVLVGAGPRESAIREAVSRAGIDDCVEFAGRIEPGEELRRADVFLLPSLQEGFSNALLEAMAAGLPVVATDVGGNREAVTDGEGGRLVPARDAAGLAAAVLEIAADRAEMKRMGAANRARVAERFTIQRSAEHLARFYAGEDIPV